MAEKEKEILEEELEENVEEADTAEETAESEASENEEKDTDDASESIDTEDDKKKGIFNKKKDKKDKKDEQIEELSDRLKRQMAEFDNFRKRTDKEKTQMYDMGASTVVEKILPVIDNFERGLNAVPDDKKDDPFVEGMDKIYKQMMTVLAEAGVTPIEAEGKEFDPNLHNAVMHVEDDSFGENVVAEELLKGYMYKETVVRHSMVKVAN